MIPVNSIEIPGEFMYVCDLYAGNESCMLRAISSTGGLTTGNRCPVSDYADQDDKMRKWYYSIWTDLYTDIGYAIKCATVNLESMGEPDDDGWDDDDEREYEDTSDELHALEDFLAWTEQQLDRLELSYNLEDY